MKKIQQTILNIIYLLICIFIVLIEIAKADPCLGLDTLALAKQNVTMISQEMSSNTCVGFLQGTFGDALPNMKTLLSTGKVKAWREHLCNYTCIRGHNCETGEPKINDYNTLQDRAISAETLFKQYPNIPCFLSPWLEYDVTDPVMVNKWFSILKQYAPDCTPIASIGSSHVVPAGVQVEKHGNLATAFSRSNDGTSYFDSNIDVYKRSGTNIVLAWWPRMNMRVSGEKFFTPPSERTATATRDEVQQAVYTLNNTCPAVPKFSACPAARELNPNEIWKVRSEDYNGHDPRENKAVLIVKARVSKFVIITPAGKLIGYLRYYGPYSALPGYYRYYIGTGSNQTPMQLLKAAGGEWVCLKSGNIQYAVSAVRRSGNFR